MIPHFRKYPIFCFWIVSLLLLTSHPCLGSRFVRKAINPQSPNIEIIRLENIPPPKTPRLVHNIIMENGRIVTQEGKTLHARFDFDETAFYSSFSERAQKLDEKSNELHRRCSIHQCVDDELRKEVLFLGNEFNELVTQMQHYWSIPDISPQMRGAIKLLEKPLQGIQARAQYLISLPHESQVAPTTAAAAAAAAAAQAKLTSHSSSSTSAAAAAAAKSKGQKRSPKESPANNKPARKKSKKASRESQSPSKAP